jgi:arylformamidase
MSRMHDVTMTFCPEMPGWPLNPGPDIRPLRAMHAGAHNNVTLVDFHVHSGTHVDAPRHFVADGYGVDRIPLDVLVGSCTVVHFPDAPVITPEMLGGLDLPEGVTRLLLRTRNSEFLDDFAQGFRADYTALTPEAGRWAVDRGIRLLGIDYLSIERYKEPHNATHRVLLENEVILLEGLDLRGIAPGTYDLYCLPVKIRDCDGAPARVILIEP